MQSGFMSYEAKTSDSDVALNVAQNNKSRSIAAVSCLIIGGQGRNRTADTQIFSLLLYQLSYLAGNLFKKREGRV